MPKLKIQLIKFIIHHWIPQGLAMKKVLVWEFKGIIGACCIWFNLWRPCRYIDQMTLDYNACVTWVPWNSWMVEMSQLSPK